MRDGRERETKNMRRDEVEKKMRDSLYLIKGTGMSTRIHRRGKHVTEKARAKS